MSQEAYFLRTYKSGKGSPIVLLHGMAASHRYWYKVKELLVKRNAVVTVDLLGFGVSPKPHDAEYSYKQHVQSIKRSLDELGIKKPFTLAGHSMGALIAGQYATEYPDDVSNLILVNPPLYKNPTEAKKGVTQGSFIKRLGYFGLISRMLCNSVCNLPKSVSKTIYLMNIKNLDPHIAADIADHTYTSYKRSMDKIILNQDLMNNFHKLSSKLTIITSDRDEKIALKNTIEVSQKHKLKLHKLKGGHGLPIESPLKIASIIVDK